MLQPSSLEIHMLPSLHSKENKYVLLFQISSFVRVQRLYIKEPNFENVLQYLEYFKHDVMKMRWNIGSTDFILSFNIFI